MHELACTGSDKAATAIFAQVAYSIATVVSVASFYLKAKVLVDQLRNRRAEVTTFEEDGKNVASFKRLKKHRRRLVKTQRTLRLTYASMMVGSAEVRHSDERACA